MKFLRPLLAAFALASPAFADDPVKVVFLTGDDEYRSEESMPMIARILERDYGFETVVGFSLNEAGEIDPNAAETVTEMESLDEADLMVLFYRYRRPTEAQFSHFLKYIESGKPIVAFRTSTHAFRFEEARGRNGWGWQSDPKQIHSLSGGEKVGELLGQSWITHHGHFDDGNKPLTQVEIADSGADSPILNGVEPFPAYSWLYHVEGGGDEVQGDPTFLLEGTSLESSKEKSGQTDQYPLTNPVAWTKPYQFGEGPEGKVFMTTLGHPYDFKDANMRRLTIQGILWALGKEALIPEEGVDVTVVGEYEPNNSGFGAKHKLGLTPEAVSGE